MSEKLIAKTQELNPRLSQFHNSFSKCISISPETKELLAKKGVVYAVFEISGPSNFDTSFVAKVIDDVLHDSYYQSDNISPTQSMEKAIMEMREKIIQLSNDTLVSNPGEISMNFISAIVWGNVIYMIKFGEIENYIMKGGEIKQPDMISEGSFSSYSELLDEDDVFIFCTKPFSNEFPVEKLLSSSISEGDLKPNQTCLLMRITKDTSSPQEEKIDLGLGNAVSKSQNRERLDKATNIVRDIYSGTLLVLNNLLKFIRPVLEYFNKLLGKVIPKRKAILFTRKITNIAETGNKKTKGWLFLVIIAVLFSISVFFTFRSRIFKEENPESDPIIENTISGDEQLQNLPQEDRSRDAEFKIQRVSPEVFYDLRIADNEAEPTELKIVGDRIVAVDRTTGKIYHSEISSPNFIQEDNTYTGIKSLGQTEGLLSFNDNAGYKTYNLEDSELIDSYQIEDLNLTYPYSGYIYSISNDILTRSSEENGDLEGVLWGQNPDFKDARSMAIAYTVFVLTRNGELVEYSGGSKTDFSVSGLENQFNNPVKVIADLDFSNIYVADSGNKSIVVLDEDGNLVKQYRNEEAALWQDIRGIAVSEDESAIFVLDSAKIYNINAEE
jgi:hypothetical protein